MDIRKPFENNIYFGTKTDGEKPQGVADVGTRRAA